MESKIDWSKAPEDATHYQAATHGVFECWLKPGHSVRVSRREQDWREDGYADDLIATSAIKRPWSGEGLPPVGVVCEYRCANSQWRQVKVIAHMIEMQKDNPCAVSQLGDTGPLCIGGASSFRPIRTPEQIAADEREAAIDEMLASTPAPGSDISLRVCEKLYDAGYRKP